MICAWQALESLLPRWMQLRRDDSLREIRLRLGEPPELVLGTKSVWGSQNVTREDLDRCVNAASRYSPWTAASAAQGYLTAPGGHRIGLCGEAVVKDGQIAGIRELQSLCIRVARDVPGLIHAPWPGSVLILGAPGWGKTTLLRDLIRQISRQEPVSVVDERRELFPPGFQRGKRTDVLTGCPKAQGMEMVLRAMSPGTIAVDEITSEADCRAILSAANCGVRLLATAHAGSLEEFCSRRVYRPLVEEHIFGTVVLLAPDQSYRAERRGL